MSNQKNKQIVAVVEDLMFTVKINEAAKKAGLPINFVKSEEDVLEKAKNNPAAIIFDLNCGAVNPLKVIARLKADDDFKRISLIGYLSHVQGELKMEAHDAGCDIVMTRSAFSQNLPTILKRHANNGY
jgi:ActR/RegA family two-component response regulator